MAVCQYYHLNFFFQYYTITVYLWPSFFPLEIVTMICNFDKVMLAILTSLQLALPFSTLLEKMKCFV